jgi:EPS-associated MarR family transcriptional regulator
MIDLCLNHRSTVERPMHSISDDIRYRLLKYLDGHPEASQRAVARELGISLGKVNYCLKALIQKGWVKVRNFTNSEHKTAYAYILTTRGIEEKVNATQTFLRRKVAEYELLVKEIETLTGEVDGLKQEKERSDSWRL